MERTIRVLVMAATATARMEIERVVERIPDADVVGEVSSPQQASVLPDLLRPDVIVVDLEDVSWLMRLDFASTAVIVVAQSDAHAAQAFAQGAVDFVVKPLSPERMATALDYAHAAVVTPPTADAKGARAHDRDARVVLRVGRELKVFKVHEIDWIDAEDYYARVHIGGRSFLVRKSLQQIEDCLPEDMFVRIHRSSIVNVERVAALQPLPQGDYHVTLLDGTRLRMSRRRREPLAQLLDNVW